MKKANITVRPRGDHRVCYAQYVKQQAELAARRSQVRALRKMVRAYEKVAHEARLCGPASVELADALAAVEHLSDDSSLEK